MKIRYSGLGGQGVVVSGVIHGHAAMIEGHNVLQNQSYGSTTRGGVTTSDVSVKTGQIYEFECAEFDILIALCQEACDKFLPKLSPKGILITESSLVDVDPDDIGERKFFPIPAIEQAREQLGRQILANIVVLGVISKLVDMVSEESLRKAIREHVPKGTEQLNMKAFDLGRNLVNGLAQ